MLRLVDIIDKYNPPRELRGIIGDFYYRIAEDELVTLHKFKNLRDVEEFIDDDGCNTFTIEIVFELVGYGDLSRPVLVNWCKGTSEMIEEEAWEVLLNLNMRQKLSSKLRVNGFNGEVDLEEFIKYINKIKLNEYIEHI